MIEVGEAEIEVGEAGIDVGEAGIDVGVYKAIEQNRYKMIRFSSKLEFPAVRLSSHAGKSNMLENLMAGKSNGWKI